MPTIYKITFPNGKIYVGSDTTDDVFYFGTPSDASKASMAADYPPEKRLSFAVTKDVLWQGLASRSDLVRREHALIVALRANDPSAGYNLTPRWRG